MWAENRASVVHTNDLMNMKHSMPSKQSGRHKCCTPICHQTSLNLYRIWWAPATWALGLKCLECVWGSRFFWTPMSCHARPAKSSIMPEGAASAHPTPLRWSLQTVAAYQRPVVNRQWPLANCKWVRVNIGGDDLITKHQRHINDTYSHHMPELKETSMCPRVLWELAPIGLSVDLSLVESITFSNVTQHVAGEGIEFISGTGLRTYREEFWALDVSIKVPHFSIPCHIWNSAQP